MTENNVCGELCSLRLTWQKPEKDISYEKIFLCKAFAGLLDDLKTYRGRHIDIDTNYQKERSQLLKNYQHQINFLESDLKVKN